MFFFLVFPLTLDEYLFGPSMNNFGILLTCAQLYICQETHRPTKKLHEH